MVILSDPVRITKDLIKIVHACPLRSFVDRKGRAAQDDSTRRV